MAPSSAVCSSNTPSRKCSSTRSTCTTSPSTGRSPSSRPLCARGLAVLADHGTTAGEVRTLLPIELLSVVVAEQRFRYIQQMVNMLRIVDLPGAMAARGYLPERAGPVHVRVSDQAATWNEGRWSSA